MAANGLEDEMRQRLLAAENVEDDRAQPEDQQQYGTFFPPPPPLLHTAPIPTTHAIYARDPTELTKTASRPKRYRLVLLITLGFDLGLVVFLSIISFVNSGGTDVLDYFKLSIDKSLFDLVLLSLLRFVLNSLFYILLAWVTRLVITLTVVGSTFYVPVKGYFYWSALVSEQQEEHAEIQYIIVLLLLFASFVVPWFEAFFFEFKYLPSELSRLQSVKWWDWRLWLCPWMIVKRVPPSPRHQPPAGTLPPRPPEMIHHTNLLRYSSLDTVFRTPTAGSPILSPRVGSPTDMGAIREESMSSSTEPPPAECDILSPTDELYVRKGLEAMDILEALTSTDNGWNLEKNQNGITVYSQVRSHRKIWKSEMVLNYNMETVWHTVYQEIHRMSEWNKNLSSIEILHRVDHHTDIMYSVAVAVGPISQRDFVSVRRGERKNGIYYVASMSVEFSEKPPVSGRVRGENGPSGQAIVPLDRNQCKFIWVFDIDPKVWLMQTLIDQTYAGILTNANINLRTYLQNM